MLETFQSVTLFYLPLLGNVCSFKIAMSIAIPIAILLILATFSVVFATIYISCQRKQMRVHGKY